MSEGRTERPDHQAGMKGAGAKPSWWGRESTRADGIPMLVAVFCDLGCNSMLLCSGPATAYPSVERRLSVASSIQAVGRIPPVLLADIPRWMRPTPRPTRP